ncbi:MAG TPA: hypothetical protein VI229_03240 [Burkholderiales bacterium]
MRGIFWLAVIGFMLAAGGIVWYSLRKWKERQAAEEERLAAFMAASAGRPRMVEASPAPAAIPAVMPAAAGAGNGIAQQKLLFEAAHKAGEAGEPALAIQLYARLLARFPASAFASQARAAVEAEKKKLAKA